MDLLQRLYESSKRIFSSRNIALLWRDQSSGNARARASYYVKKGRLRRLTRGIFALPGEYEPRELAGSLYTPSYISFETVLRDHGIIFQYYETMFVAGNLSRSVVCDGKKITYRKIKTEILLNPLGVEHHVGYSIASKERALLDMLYRLPKAGFDNLGGIDWARCLELAPIYKSARLLKKVEEFRKKYAE